jgi:hypothetical protein
LFLSLLLVPLRIFGLPASLLRLRKNARLDDLVTVDQQSAQNRTVLFCFNF